MFEVAAVAERLSATDPRSLEGGALVEVVGDYERLVAWAQARQAAAVAVLAARMGAEQAAADGSAELERERVDGPELASAELAARLHLTRLTADLRVGEALALATVHEETRAAWEAGRLDAARVRRILAETELLPAELASAVARRVLPRGEDQTTSELTRSLRRAVQAVDPEAARRRHRRARELRSVSVVDLADAMAELQARGPVHDVHTVFACLDVLAGDGRAGEGDVRDDRPVGARRFDALRELASLLLDGHHVAIGRGGRLTPTEGEQHASAPASGAAATGAGAGATDAAGTDAAAAGAAGTHAAGTDPGGDHYRLPRRRSGRRWWSRRAELHVTVSAATLLGLDDEPAELAGYGPIPADLAREIAADTTWRRLLTDDVSGTLLDVGTRTYVPPPALGRHVRTRDPVCVFPGCRRSADRCDLDHERPFPSGPTSADNLAPLCRTHHRLKTHGRWRKQRQPDGSTVWTSPAGQTVIVPGTDLRRSD